MGAAVAAAGEGAGVATAAPASDAATAAGTAKKAAPKKTTAASTGSTRRRKPVDQGYIDALKKGDQKKGKPQAEPEEETTEVRVPSVTVPSAVDTGAGMVLAVLFWWWVGLPFLQGGMKGVQAQLRAKFFNKSADGSWLP